ncbi:MAG: ribonuclease HII [Candidatus Kerfeldbacteria bacterium]|nr:ribonuclease HII [Candidatus Kerfeldbacteria bacterium]
MAKTKPNRKEELALRQAGYEYIAGVDEAGKGAWAGPLVAAAVILPADFSVAGVNDSKVLSAAQREKLFVHITRQALSWAVAVVSSQYIDQHGIVKANKKALLDAVKKLHRKPAAVLVDAVPIKHGKKPVKAIVDGDAKVVSIAAASIVAKVVRDTLMNGEHRLYPEYEFHRHKGYGTSRHHQLLLAHGPSPIHRRSFRPLNGSSVARRVAGRRVPIRSSKR